MNFGGRDGFTGHRVQSSSTWLSRFDRILWKRNINTKIGIYWLVAIVFVYMLSHVTEPWVSAVITVTGSFIWNIFTTSSCQERSLSEDNLKKNLENLTQENESYRHARDISLQKLSPLKRENESLKSQIERQTQSTTKLIEDVERLEKGKRNVVKEYNILLDQSMMEKQNHRAEYQKLEEKLKTIEERNEMEVNQLKTFILQLEIQNKISNDEKAKMEQDIRRALEEKRMLEREYGTKMLLIQREQNNMEVERNEFKKKIQVIQDKLNSTQTQASQTKRQLEIQLKEAKKYAVDLSYQHDQLKLKLQESGRPICNICIDRQLDTFLDPCGHTICLVCATEVQQRSGECPICRKKIKSTKTLYFS